MDGRTKKDQAHSFSLVDRNRNSHFLPPDDLENVGGGGLVVVFAVGADVPDDDVAVLVAAHGLGCVHVRAGDAALVAVEGAGGDHGGGVQEGVQPEDVPGGALRRFSMRLGYGRFLFEAQLIAVNQRKKPK